MEKFYFVSRFSSNLSDAIVKFIIIFFVFLTCSAFARLDRDGNGLSDLWQALYPRAVLDRITDTDGDGRSDFDEGVAGTNPLDPNSYFRADLSESSEPFSLVISTEPGKSYQIEKIDASAGWVAEGQAFVAQNFKFIFDLSDASRGVYRVTTSDVDADGDGLDAWEEARFGFSDNTRYSSRNTLAGTTDYLNVYAQLEGQGLGFLPSGQTFEKSPASRAEVVRFLAQASWGASPDLVAEVEEQGIANWLIAQTETEPQQTIASAISGNAPITAATIRILTGMGVLRAAMVNRDQVSLRMAQALSEIVVVSTSNDTFRGNFPLQRAYYEILKRNSLGNYRELLEEISYSSAMGLYLSYVQNQRSDPSIGRFPDENYAREIMQLFTVGLVLLEQNGEPVRDADGNEIPTYGNKEITEMAKIFTGFGYGGPSGIGFFAGVPGNQLFHPMRMYDDFHEPGEKVLIGGAIVPAGQTGEEDISDALDILCEHQNIAPFISRLLIQRLVTSNPSPDYIKRVAGVWADDGEGERGNLKAVARAILMDPEARNSQVGNDTFGRVRGPYERFVAMLRAFNARNERTRNNLRPTFPVQLAFFFDTFGQVPLQSPSVFNFYLPDHQPAGELRNRGLVAPELEIATNSNTLLTDNFIRRFLDIGLPAVTNRDQDRVFLDFTDALEVANDGEALFAYLDDLLTGGVISQTTRTHFLSAYEREPDRSPEALVRLGVHLLIESPDFSVLK